MIFSTFVNKYFKSCKIMDVDITIDKKKLPFINPSFPLNIVIFASQDLQPSISYNPYDWQSLGSRRQHHLLRQICWSSKWYWLYEFTTYSLFACMPARQPPPHHIPIPTSRTSRGSKQDCDIAFRCERAATGLAT